MESKHFFAADLGATSGRTILGTVDGERISLEEVSRFNNNMIEATGHVYWDIFALYNEIIGGLREVARRGISISSIGIDTWGVDIVCIGNDGGLLANPIAYRDTFTMPAMDDYFRKVANQQHVYGLTGTQFMYFNTLFKLYAMRCEGNSALQNAKKVLFMPDALSYMLTGKAVCERTIASTSQFLNPRTGELEASLLGSVGMTTEHFGQLVQPGTVVGTLTDEVQRLTGLPAVPVVAVAGHDTASAVAAVPAADEQFAYLSSGTWSLMGIETPEPIIDDVSFKLNFTNEGGIDGTTRFLKNICGMWIYERCRKEWTDAPRSHADLIAEAMRQQPFNCIINPDDAAFVNPPSMLQAIADYCHRTGQTAPTRYAQTCRCIFESLALRYREVFGWLKDIAKHPIKRLHIIGGGSQNALLNQFTADALGVEVVAGPVECTAIGNIMMQARATGLIKDRWDMRRIIANSSETKRFVPDSDNRVWDAAFERYKAITNNE